MKEIVCKLGPIFIDICGKYLDFLHSLTEMRYNFYNGLQSRPKLAEDVYYAENSMSELTQ